MSGLSEKTRLEMRIGAEAVARHERIKTLAILETRKIIRCSGYGNVEVWVGDTMFTDPHLQWPSELLMAQVALAIEGGLHLKKED